LCWIGTDSVLTVFLRALEYFQGILFLTTNRVGHFDEAFLSRIHVSIGYEPLDDDARAQIWDGLFRKLAVDHKNGGPEITFEREAKRYVQKDEDVRALKWNGREIRNGRLSVHCFGNGLPELRKIIQLSRRLLHLLSSRPTVPEKEANRRRTAFRRSLKRISLKSFACQLHSSSTSKIHTKA
jgi:hypothetical protein